MYKSIILPQAKEDIRAAAKWYAKRQDGLGKRFAEEVREKVHFLSQNPLTSNFRYDCVRTAVLNIFPFMVHYTFDENRKAIIISAVLHTSRNPDLWMNR